MAKNQLKFLKPSSTQIQEMRDLAKKGNGFFHIPADEVPSIIPSELKEKWDSAVVVVSGNSPQSVLIVGHRIDQKSGMMDQDPFLFEEGLNLNPKARSAVLIHHASFDSRSLDLPNTINASSTENYYKDNPPYGLSSGSTGQLPDPLFQAYNIANDALSSTRAST